MYAYELLLVQVHSSTPSRHLYLFSSRAPVRASSELAIFHDEEGLSPNFSTFSTFNKFLIINLFALDNNKNGNLFLIRFDQICPNWIKLDQIWISHLSKNVSIKSCHIYHENKHGQFFFRSDQFKTVQVYQT